jgi:ribonuclease HI
VQVVVHVDGGARGNPGPAAAAAVVSTPDGRVLDEAAVTLGQATNNVAEYRGLLLGLERAAALGATEVDVINDSELVAKQVNGDYRVKHADLKPLHEQARSALGGFERWSIRSVPRAQNAAADALVNRALDGEEPPAVPASGAHDDLLFSAVDQAYELWFELILQELKTARDELAAGRPQAAAPRLRRVVAVWRLLRDQRDVLGTISPEGFLAFRDPLAPASGFQSRRFREIEWLSGERGTWPGGDPPAGPSLYEAFVAGLGLPEDRDARLAAIADIHRDHADDPLRAAWHDVAELLLDHDKGVGRLRSTVDRRFFPELWDVRLAL